MNSHIPSQFDEIKPKGAVVLPKKIITTFLYFTGASSLGYIISILSFYFHAKNILGWFPTYDNPDPGKLVAFKKYNSIIEPAFEIWVICLLIWTVLAIFYLVINQKHVKWKHLVVSSIGHIIALMITFSNIFGWYVD
jgi:uncharacterized BrkB/YihY/UPF0761 family membrane protein